MDNLDGYRSAELGVNDLIRDLNRLTFLNDLAAERAQTEPNFFESTLLSTLRNIDELIFTIQGLTSIPKLVAFSFLEMLTFHKNVVIENINNQAIALANTYAKVSTTLVRNKVIFTIPKLVAFSLLVMMTFHKNVVKTDISQRVNAIYAHFVNTLGHVSRYIYSVKNFVSSIEINLPTNSFKLAILRPALSVGLVITLVTSLSGVSAIADELNGDETVSVSSEQAPEPEVTSIPEPTVGDEVIVEETPAISADEVVPDVEPSASPSIEPSLVPVVIEAPSNLNYQVLVEGIKLTWDKSTSTVDKYVVNIGPDNRIIDVNSDTAELLLTDLNRKSAYSFTVTAISGELQSSVLGPLNLDLASIKFPRPPMNAEVGGLIVKFNNDLSSSEVTALADQSDLVPVELEVSKEISTDTRLVEFNEPVNVTTAQEIADSLEASSAVEFAELDFAFNTAATDELGSVVPNDPLYASKQWSLWGNFGIGIADGPSGLALAYQNSTGLGSVVAVIDTGFTSHPDLEGQFVSGYDFVSNNEMLSGIREENGTAVPYDGDYIDSNTYGPIGWDDNPQDPGDWNSSRSSSWHGTHVAGLIAALTNNGIGIAGIAPDAKIQPLRAFSWRGGLLSDVIASITWASGGTVENVPANKTPAKVINLSFSVEAPCTPSLQQAIDDAVARGSVVVAAAGNNNQNANNFAPGNCNNVITVGAIDSNGDRANYSNFGDAIDISAPGGELDGQAIYSTSNDGKTTPTSAAYSVKQGTSIAAAYVSAAIAKLAQTNPADNAVALRAKVLSKESVRPFTRGVCLTDENCGLGYLFFGINALPGARTGTNANNELFLGGNYIELGISRKGNFGTSSGGGKPAGFNGSASRNYIGMSADHDGFGVGTDDKNMDYFLPGSPEERFAYGYKVGATSYARSNSELNSADNLPSVITNTSSGDVLSATVTTTWTSVMTVQQKIQFNVNDKFFRNEVTITNNSGALMDSARFMRSFDPDNTVDSGLGSGYSTRNTINFQQPGDGKTQVTAESSSSFVIGSRTTSTYPIVFYSTDADARAATWGFANSNPYTGSAFDSAQAKGYTTVADQAITITWQTSNLAAGASDSFVYYTSLDQRDFADVVAEVQAAEAAASSSISPTTQTISGSIGSAITPSSALTGTGYTGSVTYAVTSGTLPAGLTLDTSTGIISGTPTTASSATITITGTGATSGSATTSITFSISDITPSSGGGSTPTPTPTPTASIRPNNLITNPLLPIPTPTPQATNPTLVPGIPNGPRPLVIVPIENLINALRPIVIDLFTNPTPQATSAGATPAPTFSNQQALSFINDTQDKKVVDLPSLVLYNGEYQPSKLVIVDNTVAQIVSPGGGLLNLQAKDGQNSVPVDSRGRVQMVRSNNVETEGTGLAPNSEFAVYLFSTPTLLGIGKTDSQGRFFASFPVKNELPIGDHTLQVNGLLPDGKTSSVSVPVSVVESVAVAKKQAMPKTIFVDVNPVDRALRAMYWILIVLGVMVFLIGASYRDRFFALVKRRKDDDEEIQPVF